MLTAILLAANLLVLTRVDGYAVIVNPHQITSLRSPVGKYQHLAPTGHCIIYLTDRTFIGVLESCEAVRLMLDK